MYYHIIRGLDELVGERGILKLPIYFSDTFVIDSNREEIIKNVKKDLISGKSVLLTGYSGSGKNCIDGLYIV